MFTLCLAWVLMEKSEEDKKNRTTGKAENERITGQALAAAARMARPAAGKYFI